MMSVPNFTATPAGALISMARPVTLSSPRSTTMRRTPWASGAASAMVSARAGGGTLFAGACAKPLPKGKEEATSAAIANRIFICCRRPC
jgi:hypothetical protein